MHKTATKGSTCSGVPVNWSPISRVLIAGLEAATRGSQLVQSTVKSGSERVLVGKKKLFLAKEGSTVSGFTVNGTIDGDVNHRVLVS